MATKKGRPLVVIDAFFQFRASTGIRTYINELCLGVESLQGSEFDYLIIPNLNKVNSFNYFQGSISRIRSWAFHIIYFFWKQIFLPAFCLYKRAEVLICPDYILPACRLDLLKIGVVHSPFFWQHPEHYNRFWLKYFIGMIESGFNGSSVAVTTSVYTKNCLNEYLNLDVPIQVVYQSAKPIVTIQGNGGLIDSFELEKDGFILHVGYFDKRKNLKTLVLAFSELILKDELKNIKLVLAGGRATGSSDSYDDITRLVDELGLKGRVILPGHVSELELSLLYKNAILYVFPSFNEGFGIPVLEAISQRLAVIVSDSGSLKEVGGDAVVVFSTFDVSNLTEKMTDLIINEEIRQGLVERGVSRLESFSRKNFVRDFEKLIERSLNDRHNEF